MFPSLAILKLGKALKLDMKNLISNSLHLMSEEGVEHGIAEIKRSKGLTFAVERVKTKGNMVNQRKVVEPDKNLLSEISSETSEFINIEAG
jgi:hypothetical protein